MFLSNNWDTLICKKNIQEEVQPCLAKGHYRSWNTTNQNLAILGEFIKLRRPQVVLECGTFEGRTTEYLGRLMSYHIADPVLITVDVSHDIHDITETTVTYYKDSPRWLQIMDIRKSRLNILSQIEGLEFVYHEKLVRDILEEILSKYQVDFIYQDASHLPGLQRQEWEIIDRLSKPGDIICYDDAVDESGNFFDYIGSLEGWHCIVNDIDPGHRQLWVEKI